MWSILRRVTPVGLCGRALFMLIFFALAFVQMPLRADLAIGDAAGPGLVTRDWRSTACQCRNWDGGSPGIAAWA